MAKKEQALVLEPKDVSFSENDILEFYVADSIKSSLEAFVEAKKSKLKSLKGQEGFVDSDGKTSFSVVDSEGLEINLSTTAGRKSFNQEKAVNAIKEKMGQKILDKEYSKYTIERRPKMDVPKDVLEILNKYFKITKTYEINEQTIWASGLSQAEIEQCYDMGADVLKVTKKSKIPPKMLVAKYQERKLDLIERLLTE